MLKKITSLLVISALYLTLAGSSASAQTSADRLSVEKSKPDPIPAAKAESQTRVGLKGRLSKLVADAKADKALSIPDVQIQPKQSNGLSKGAKIAIAAGIAGAIILIIVYKHTRNHLFD